MQQKLLAILAPLLLAACATPPNSPDAAASASPSAESVVTAIIGTPLLIALKIPICAATLPVVAVGAGMSAPVERGEEARRVLADGLAQNCGPPYAVMP